MTARLLLTSVGRRVAFVRAVRAASERRGVPLEILGTDIDPLASAGFEVDELIRQPRFNDSSFVPFLIELCEGRGVRAIAPLIDPDARLLSTHRAAFEELGVVAAAVHADHADTIDDKWVTAQFFSAAGVSSPATWLNADDLPDSLNHGVLVKPRRGSAGIGIIDYDLDQRPPVPAGAMLQQRVDGREITIDVCCERDGAPVSVAMRERLEVRSGEVAKGRTVWDSEVADAVGRLVPELRAVGPITLQCFLTRDGPVFIEINGRVGGGIPLAIHAGARTDEMLVALCLGEELGSGRAAAGHFMTRFDDQHFSSGPPSFGARR